MPKTSEMGAEQAPESYDFERLTPDPNTLSATNAFWLRKLVDTPGYVFGAHPQEAILYGPANRAKAREEQIRSGLTLINTVWGEGEVEWSDDPVVVEVPDLEFCAGICQELERRRPAGIRYAQEQIAELEDVVKDPAESSVARKAAKENLKRWRQYLSELQQPYDPRRLFLMLLNVREAQNSATIPNDLRRAMGALKKEQRWKALRNELIASQ